MRNESDDLSQSKLSNLRKRNIMKIPEMMIGWWTDEIEKI